MTTENCLIIFAIISGPLIAVQVTRWLDKKKGIRERKLAIFKTLMMTRAYVISTGHVEALNKIDLEFSHSDTKDKQVIDAWKAYLDLLSGTNISSEQWNIRRIDLLIDLLDAMGKSLDYNFDKTHIKNSTYSPRAHGKIEDEQEEIRQGIITLLNGKISIPVTIRNDTNVQTGQ